MRTIAQLARDLSPKDAKVRKRIHRQLRQAAANRVCLAMLLRLETES
jgi:hypothetical protein